MVIHLTCELHNIFLERKLMLLVLCFGRCHILVNPLANFVRNAVDSRCNLIHSLKPFVELEDCRNSNHKIHRKHSHECHKQDYTEHIRNHRNKFVNGRMDKILNGNSL